MKYLRNTFLLLCLIGVEIKGMEYRDKYDIELGRVESSYNEGTLGSETSSKIFPDLDSAFADPDFQARVSEFNASTPTYNIKDNPIMFCDAGLMFMNRSFPNMSEQQIQLVKLDIVNIVQNSNDPSDFSANLVKLQFKFKELFRKIEEEKSNIKWRTAANMMIICVSAYQMWQYFAS